MARSICSSTRHFHQLTSSTPTPKPKDNTIMITLECNYSKKLGLPGARLYKLLQEGVDTSIKETGYLPATSGNGNGNGQTNGSNGQNRSSELPAYRGHLTPSLDGRWLRGERRKRKRPVCLHPVPWTGCQTRENALVSSKNERRENEA
jgi:hypothetical protein